MDGPGASASANPIPEASERKPKEVAETAKEDELFLRRTAIIASVLNPNDLKGWRERL